MSGHTLNYVVRGCVDDGEHVEEVPDNIAEFFGLYYQLPDGLLMWDSDHNTREEAEEFAFQNETGNL